MATEQDPLSSMPPTGKLRNAKSAGGGSTGMAMPRPSAAALSLTGAGPTASLLSKMMALEKLVEDISKELGSDVLNSFAPAIQQMRDLGAARLADQAGGGIGATNPEAAAPPPGMGMMSMGGGGMAPGGPGGAGLGMAPPPMPMI